VIGKAKALWESMDEDARKHVKQSGAAIRESNTTSAQQHKQVSNCDDEAKQNEFIARYSQFCGLWFLLYSVGQHGQGMQDNYDELVTLSQKVICNNNKELIALTEKEVIHAPRVMGEDEFHRIATNLAMTMNVEIVGAVQYALKWVRHHDPNKLIPIHQMLKNNLLRWAKKSQIMLPPPYIHLLLKDVLDVLENTYNDISKSAA